MEMDRAAGSHELKNILEVTVRVHTPAHPPQHVDHHAGVQT